MSTKTHKSLVARPIGRRTVRVTALLLFGWVIKHIQKTSKKTYKSYSENAQLSKKKSTQSLRAIWSMGQTFWSHFLPQKLGQEQLSQSLGVESASFALNEWPLELQTISDSFFFLPSLGWLHRSKQTFICVLIVFIYVHIYIYMVSCPVLTDPPPPWYGGGVGTRIRYTHCISTRCRLSTLPQYYKPPPHHRGGWGILYTTTIPQTTPTPQGGGNPLLPPPMGGEGGGTGQHCTIYILYIYIYSYIYIYIYRSKYTII